MKQHPLRSFLLTVVRPLFKLIFPYKVKGIENLQALDGKGVIICCNHISVVDPVFVLMGQKRPVYYMAKAELFRKKFVAWILGNVMGAFPVERGKGDMTAVNYAFDLVNGGEILGIFPQGTCVRSRELGKPKSGAALIAARTGATVVPACLVTKDFHVRAFRRTTLVFGTPLTSEDLQVVNEEHPKLRHASRMIMESIDALIENEMNGGDKMQVLLAKSAGFCFGVNKAVNAVYDLLDAGEKVATLGPIIHNPQLVEKLQKRGVTIVDTPREVDKDTVLVIRSHGVPKSVYDEIAACGVRMYDATCPFVSKIHRIVAEKSAAGYHVYIAGNAGHPEVMGICGHCEGAYTVISSPEELEENLKNTALSTDSAVIMVAQTTYNTISWKKCAEILKKHYTNPLIFDTICNATAERQGEAIALSQQCDKMVIVGGRQSSNTAKLFDVCAVNCPTILVETAAELDMTQFADVRCVGLTAGASTPADIIKEVQTIMSEEKKIVAAEAVDTTSESAFEEMTSEEYERAIDATFQNPTDDKVRGLVVSIAPNEVQVEVIGRKQTGYIPAEELSADPNANPADVVKVGDELELLIMRTNDQEGTIMLSKKRVDSLKGWNTVVEAEASGEVLEGTVTEVIKGGVLVVTNGVRVFVPASHASIARMEDLTPLKGQTVRFKVIEINTSRRRAVASIRLVAREERKEQEAALWSKLEVGQEYTGTVKSLTSYGAFVDLGGVDGMIHISELSWSRIKHPSEVVNVGDTVTVYIRELDAEKRKISLGYRKAEDNPWEIFKANYNVDDVVDAKVVGMTAFGAFAQIIPGIDGLIHISQIADRRIDKPQDELKVGQEVKVKITNVDFENKRISLSIRALIEPAAAEEVAEEAAAEETAEDAE